MIWGVAALLVWLGGWRLNVVVSRSALAQTRAVRRLVPLVRALINYPAGVARMPVRRFLLFSALGSLPWNAALLLAGYLLGENYRTLYDVVRPYELVIYGLVVVGTAWLIYRWLWGPRRDRAT